MDMIPGQYQALNVRNKSWYYSKDDKMELLDDLDCMFLESLYQERQENPDYLANKQLFYLIDKEVNFNERTVKLFEDLTVSYKLIRGDTKDRIRK